MTRPGIEPWSPGPLANTQLISYTKLTTYTIIIMTTINNNNYNDKSDSKKKREPAQ